MAAIRPVLVFLYLQILLGCSLTHAQTTSTSLSLSLTASSTGSAIDCAATTAANVSACYPNLNLIPACVRPCLTNVTLSIPCASTDFRCLCSKSAEFQQDTLQCLAVNATCSTADIQTAVNYYYSYCQSMNYPLSAVPSPATSTVINTIIATSHPSPTPSTTLLPSSSNSNSSISPGAKAGIGIGVTALALLLLLIAAFFLWRHRTRRRINASRIDAQSCASSRYADSNPDSWRRPTSAVYRSPTSALFRSPTSGLNGLYRSPSAAAELEGKNVYPLSESSGYSSSGQAVTVNWVGESPGDGGGRGNGAVGATGNGVGPTNI